MRRPHPKNLASHRDVASHPQPQGVRAHGKAKTRGRVDKRVEKARAIVVGTTTGVRTRAVAGPSGEKIGDKMSGTLHTKVEKEKAKERGAPIREVEETRVRPRAGLVERRAIGLRIARKTLKTNRGAGAKREGTKTRGVFCSKAQTSHWWRNRYTFLRWWSVVRVVVIFW